MALHLIKLSVGTDTLEDKQNWIDRTQARRRREGLPPEQIHTTRMFPKRAVELLDGGSIYWVIKGNVQARQRLIDIRPVTGADGIRRCQLVMEPALAPTAWQPRRAFQGWRYLKPDDAPADLHGNSSLKNLPPELRVELAQLGLL